MGYNAGTAITSGVQNTAMGANAMMGNSTGTFNSTLGYNSGINLTSNRNIAIGENSGRHLSSGAGNVIIGGGDLGTTGKRGSRQLQIMGYDGSTRTTWIDGDSSGNIIHAGTTHSAG